MRYFIAALLFAFPAYAAEITIDLPSVPQPGDTITLNVPGGAPPPATLCPTYDVELQPGDHLYEAMRALGVQQQVCVRVHGNHQRLFVDQNETVDHLVIDGDNAVLDCTDKRTGSGVENKACVANTDGIVAHLTVRNLTLDADVMTGANSRGFFPAGMALTLEDVTFAGCEENCVQAGFLVGPPRENYDWTFRRVTITNGNLTTGDNVLYSAENTDGTFSDQMATWLIEDSDLQGVNTQVVKSCHAYTIIRNTTITSMDGPEIHNACDGYMLLDGVTITMPAESGSRYWLAVGNRDGNNSALESPRCTRFKNIVSPDPDKPFHTIDLKNVTVIDQDTAYISPPAPRIVMRCDNPTTFRDLGGNTYNGQPIDFSGVTHVTN